MTLRDVEGRVLAVHDSSGNSAVTYAYNMRGRLAAHTSMDGGGRWTLETVATIRWAPVFVGSEKRQGRGGRRR